MTPIRRNRRPIAPAVAALVLLACGLPAGAVDDNPPAPGFDAAGSDPQAVRIADATMQAMGGRAAWDATRFVSWNFFGARFHVWDKHRGRDRVQWTDRESGAPIVAVVDVNTAEGRVWVAGVAVADPARATELLRSAREMWINDAYWLVMPYKLKDSGVTLTYAGEAAMADGRAADVVQLTFKDVGVTPQNKYRVFVARDTGLVEQWQFFSKADDAEPRFTTPWHGWTRHGAILLSGDRGERRLTDIAVHDSLPEAVFEDPAPTELPGEPGA